MAMELYLNFKLFVSLCYVQNHSCNCNIIQQHIDMLVDVKVANITFLSFLLFSMCQTIRVAVNTWLNCSFALITAHKHYAGCSRQPLFKLR